MIKKILHLILITFISIVLASIYGIVHNQISYTISEEYFTKFKFRTFGLGKFAIDFPRMSAGIIGVVSTWWFGLLIGLINGIAGMLQPTVKLMWKGAFGAIIRVLIITILFGIVGVMIGKFVISNLNINWNLPENLINPKSFLTAGTMHSFGYIGGIIGLIYGVIFQIKMKKTNIQYLTDTDLK